MKDGNIYRFSPLILILDDLNKIDYSDCDIKYRNPIHVYNDLHQRIGSGNISISSKYVHGEFSIDYSTPERLDIENKTLNIYPHISGAMFTRVELDKDGKPLREKCILQEIDGIILSWHRPDDSRIENI